MCFQCSGLERWGVRWWSGGRKRREKGGRLACVVGEDGGVAGLKVVGSGVGVADEDSSARVAFFKVEPFGCLDGPWGLARERDHWVSCSTEKMKSQSDCTYIWMPMKLPQTSWLQCNHRRGNGGRDGEDSGIDYGKCPASSRNGCGRKLREAIYEGTVACQFAVRVRDRFGADIRGRQNVWIGGRKTVEDGLIHTEVLSQDGFRRVSEPVVNLECCAVLAA